MNCNRNKYYQNFHRDLSQDGRGRTHKLHGNAKLTFERVESCDAYFMKVDIFKDNRVISSNDLYSRNY